MIARLIFCKHKNGDILQNNMSKGIHFVTFNGDLLLVHHKNGSTLKHTQNGRHFSNDSLKLNENLNEDCCILISYKFTDLSHRSR